MTHVRYLLTGTAKSADLTLQLADDGQSQQQDAAVPLRSKAGDNGLTFDAKSGQFLYLSAQINGDGDLRCRIVVDGRTIADETSDGAGAIVTCQGTA